jgi:hypothetical protein
MKEGRERENFAVFCGLGGLVKEMRGEVRCRVDVEERRGARSTCTQQGRGVPVADKARGRRRWAVSGE